MSTVQAMVDTVQYKLERMIDELDDLERKGIFTRREIVGIVKKKIRVLAQLLRFHPRVPRVWIYAAAWEFDHNLNVSAARALMQNGLRVCPLSEDLWVEYLRMELTYFNKLKVRKAALREKENGVHDYDMLLDEERGNDDGSNVGNELSGKKLDLLQEKGLSILETIYTGDVEALPSSFGLRQRLMDILQAADLTPSAAFVVAPDL
ncbi:hypothetical protein SADUNF_Sadunf07G0007400 [Salix dunnii]|uniref:U3 small nucleolar RNA-associated protein 6 N-terminal domain-containing protein n=1 Tax=Salix dunnii TaxID=1413687 RepID=A0A835MTD7_9ROSI|nr:hypothetical protein SADUNF_Sadunf07G0007400 [Salix dunnii]